MQTRPLASPCALLHIEISKKKFYIDPVNGRRKSFPAPNSNMEEEVLGKDAAAPAEAWRAKDFCQYWGSEKQAEVEKKVWRIYCGKMTTVNC